MTSPEIITPPTNTALRKAALKYSTTVEIPYFLERVDGFATEYLGKREDGLKTLITAGKNHLAISVTGGDDERKAYVIVDLAPPDEAPASIVKPGLYNEQGERDAKRGTLARPIVRALTEIEGQELTMDLHSLIARMPADRRK